MRFGASGVGLVFGDPLRFEHSSALRPQIHMSYSLNSLKGGYIGDYIGDYYRGYKGGY